MPTYRYKCPSCEALFDVYKGFDEIDSLEACPTCGRENIEGNHRYIEPRQFYGEKPDEPFYSPALGKMVKSRKAQSSEAKARGWEEVGSEDVDKQIDRADAEREKKIQGRWDELMRG